jgi:hypothetical protein
MATENLTKTGVVQIIATDTLKPTNAALKAQGWQVTGSQATTPSSGLPI